ncbi:MAG: UDP-GlcNAc:undecaprenyl-phosphate/decaprenyl-phosphate GlcNAc-phosphate transferase, partial [Ilumatobacteraceae bacterium]|nr:UDP-GlcNAc:undecaprenyl-phosphate/decaprenyl-phosphate GlcNAc-phosphate transferase [Ilumatobacteraceae bacterium]
MPSTTSYLLVGLVAAVATFVCTPIVGRVALRFGWVAQPGERRIHRVATPDVGGIAMFVGLAAAMAAARLNDRFDPIFARNTDEPRGLLLAAALMFLVGFIDDIRDISAPAKVMGTIAAAGVLTYYGVTMFYFRVPFVDVFNVSDDWVLLITVVWLLGMTQAINLIDGLDGLAAGIVAIGALAFFIYSLRLADPSIRLLPSPSIGPLVAIITVGMCVGFLPHNFNPARIFMGDGGALLLGLMLAVSTSVVGGRADPHVQG